MQRLALVCALAVLVVAALGFAASAAPAATTDFTDWTVADGEADIATGTLQGVTVTLSGTDISPPPSSTVDGTSPAFNYPWFTPQLAQSDAIEFKGFQGYSYTLQFGCPIADPVLHLASLGSILAFPLGTVIQRVSGQDETFIVSGNTVQGTPENIRPDGSTDSNGTVRLKLPPHQQTISFTATRNDQAGFPDGILIQVGSKKGTAHGCFTDWTVADGEADIATGTLRGVSVMLSGTDISSPPSSTVDGTSPAFNYPWFTPQLAQSDAIEFKGFQGYSYTLQFGCPIADPVLHLASLGSILAFPLGTVIQEVSEQDETFIVSGNKVEGTPRSIQPDGSTDSNGTVRLKLLPDQKTISFTATRNDQAGFPDGILIQVGSKEGTPLTC